MTLEFNAYSPSDSEHWFQNCYFGADDEDQEAISQSGDHSQETTANHDPKYGWVDGQQVASPSQAIAVLRLYEAVQLGFEKLPKIHAVTSFVLRRQFHRQFTPDTMCHLLDKLPRLESVVHEPWRACFRIEQEMVNNEGKQSV